MGCSYFRPSSRKQWFFDLRPGGGSASWADTATAATTFHIGFRSSTVCSARSRSRCSRAAAPSREPRLPGVEGQGSWASVLYGGQAFAHSVRRYQRKHTALPNEQEYQLATIRQSAWNWRIGWRLDSDDQAPAGRRQGRFRTLPDAESALDVEFTGTPAKKARPARRFFCFGVTGGVRWRVERFRPRAARGGLVRRGRRQSE
jgi:hypothetical protein